MYNSVCNEAVSASEIKNLKHKVILKNHQKIVQHTHDIVQISYIIPFKMKQTQCSKNIYETGSFFRKIGKEILKVENMTRQSQFAPTKAEF